MAILRLTARASSAFALIVVAGTASAAVELQLVVSGLSAPLFVTSALDSSGRLFIVEQGGKIKVLQPGSTTPTDFLDIKDAPAARVLSGGERGLLGLAFHPEYQDTGRFFVYYTSVSRPNIAAGDLVIAEYHVSAGSSNVADPTEKILLVIPHPTFSNHNGGMLAFGPDRFLYIGTGDGGGSNDPDNRAQAPGDLLGKILRIDVDPPDPALPYVAPADNPFVGQAGRDEIYVLGMRNPWRFSFDRLTGELWVADVGQGAREEIDVITAEQVAGDRYNFGWPLMEGTSCTQKGVAAGACNSSAFTPPVHEYAHAGGRCSVTGGYRYRGIRATLPAGTYVFGDWCTGEIFTLADGIASVLLNSGVNITSFGEDEAGELYVVGTGAVHKLVAPGAGACTFAITPTERTVRQAGTRRRVNVTAPDGCEWTAVSQVPWISVFNGENRSGDGIVRYEVARNTTGQMRVGTLSIAGQIFTVTQRP